jgi:photosystem II stability/assembly factor-like uncharacterized protein
MLFLLNLHSYKEVRYTGMMIIRILLVVSFVSFQILSQQFEWEKTKEPYGGAVTRIFAKGDTLLAAGKMNFYYSTDRGNRWHEVKGRKFADFTYTKDGFFIATGKDGIYRSTDLVTWSKVRYDYWNARLVTDSSGNIYATGNSNTIMSTNSGKTWTNYYYSPNTSVHISEPYLFLISERDIKRKNLYTNESWVTIPIVNAPNRRIKGNGPHIYYYGGGISRINFSYDYGNTWDYLDVSFPDMNPAEVLWDNQTIILISRNWTTTAYRSDDNGQSWTTLTGYPHQIIHLISLSGDFFAGMGGRSVMKSTDRGISWQLMNTGINDLSITRIISDQDNILYASTGGRGIIKSEDLGETWKEMNEGLPGTGGGNLVITGSNDLYTANNNRIFRRGEKDNPWVMTNYPEEINISLLSDGSKRIYAKNHSVVRVSDDKGYTWKEIYRGDSLWYFSADKKGNLFLTTFTRPYKIIMSSDRGKSWKHVYTNTRRLGGSVIDDRGSLYIIADSGIVKSTDGGKNWTLKPTSLSGSNLQLYADGEGNLFCARWKLFHSSDEGVNWQDITGSLSNLDNSIKTIHFIYGNDIHDQRTKILIGTEHGMWTVKHSTIASADDEEMQADYSLLQNYPNPFNPNTTIKFSLPQQSLVTLKVYDILGREISTLINEEKPVGTFIIPFNASNLPSGIYLYELTAGGYKTTKKMVLVK